MLPWERDPELYCRRAEGWAAFYHQPAYYGNLTPSSTWWRGKYPPRLFYHLVYSGRGSKMMEEDYPGEARAAMDLIAARTLDFHRRGLAKEILTVDNHADGVYLYLKLKERP